VVTQVTVQGMGRWTGSWLSGPASAGLGTSVDQQWRGERLGLPESGSGSVAGFGRRLGAYAVDALASYLVAGLLTGSNLPGNWSLLVFAVEYVVLISLTGQSAGMRVLGLRVGSLPGLTRPPPLAVGIRTGLLVLLIPALVWDRDNRGLHDKAAGTVVVRA
jgi:uncharacterized RDD family membrane protein YckC